MKYIHTQNGWNLCRLSQAAFMKLDLVHNLHSDKMSKRALQASLFLSSMAKWWFKVYRASMRSDKGLFCRASDVHARAGC